METSHADTPASWQNQNRKMTESRLLNDLEARLEQLRADVTERPFVYLAIAFVAGLASWTFPVRLIFSAVMRVVSFLFGPAILLMGILKVKELLSVNVSRT